jgi:hypothetical protein
MGLWRLFFAGVVAGLIVLSGHAAAMGSGPHPNLAYGIPPGPTSSARTGDPVAIVGLILSLVILGVVIGVLRAWRKPAA